jgi:gas vesicle protein
MIRTFLIGNLCGVIMAAAVTIVFAIPANSDHWRMEIWKRDGAAWTVDKNGHISWRWMVKPISDVPSRQKRVAVPSREGNFL